VITTALIPGRPAPQLIDEPSVKSMKPGSVIVDLAVEAGGNCAGSSVGKVVQKHGVSIVGHANVPSRLAADASALYAKNLFNLLKLIIDSETSKLAIDWDDEIIKGIALSRDGEIIHPNFAVKKAEAKTAKKQASEEKPSEKKTKPAAKKAPAKKTSANKKEKK
ncbi:MAG: NAD(P)(+) transhydrogenase (Re/Si-specific) subunit alpha, partial [Alphaproteobacteria bacterium]|nr:NAD(P)(+) transhydrogenase (Re/Si-specific) subunit alpha [Alphaproteobacteria bacterium]